MGLGLRPGAKAPDEPPTPYLVTRLPSTLLATVTRPLGGGTGTGLGHGQRAMSSGRPLERLNRVWQGG